jgi:hypothetical protein
MPKPYRKIQDLSVIKKYHFITSYFNGSISYWDYEENPINLNSTDTINFYLNGSVEHYSTKIYLDLQDKNDEIQFYDFSDEEDIERHPNFNFKSLHNCHSFYDDRNNSVIIQNHYKWRLNLN